MIHLEKIKFIEKWYQRFPLRLNFWILTGILFFLYYLSFLYSWESTNIDVNVYTLLRLICNVCFWILFTICNIALLSTLIPFIYYLVNRKNNNGNINIINKNNKGFIETSISKILYPLLGYIKCIIWYQDEIIPSTNIQFHRHRTKPYLISVPHIIQYHIEKIDILFIDFLKMFRMVAPLEQHHSFYQEPVIHNHEYADNIAINKNRIEDDEMKKDIQPDDWYHYKNFEFGDDIRRIIWKHYAKDRTLIIRQQEHITDYISKIKIIIDSSINIQQYNGWDNDMLLRFLDQYKIEIFTLINYLRSKVRQVELSFNGGETYISDRTDISHYLISMMWNLEYHLADNISNNTGTFIISHSLSNNLSILNNENIDKKIINLSSIITNNKIKKFHWKSIFKSQYYKNTIPAHLINKSLLQQMIMNEEIFK